MPSGATTPGTAKSEEWSATKQGRGLTAPRDKAKPSLAADPTVRRQVCVSPQSPVSPGTQHGAARNRDSNGRTEDISAHSHSCHHISILQPVLGPQYKKDIS